MRSLLPSFFRRHVSAGVSSLRCALGERSPVLTATLLLLCVFLLSLSLWVYAAPLAPGAPTFSNSTSTGVTVTAPALPAEASSMTLQRRLSSQTDADYASIKTGLAGGATYADSGLSASTSYSYRCVAISTSGNTNGTAATLLTRPSAPTNLTATAGNGVVSLAWGASSGATSYKLFRRESSGVWDGTVFATPTPNFYTDTAATNGVEYAYDVVAVNAAGQGSGSNTAYVTPNVGQGPPNDNFASAQVISGVSGTVTGNNAAASRETGEPTHLYAPRVSVWYRWTAPSTGQVVFDTVGSNFDTLLAAYSGTALSALTLQAANDDGPVGTPSEVTFAATAGTVYQVTVDGYLGEFGNITLNWRLASSTNPPGVSGAPTFSSVTASSVIVTASALPANTTSLTLQQKLSSEADTAYVTIQTGMAAAETKAVSGLMAGTAYTFRFVAVNATTTTDGTAASITTSTPSSSSAPGAPTFLEVTTVVRFRDTLFGPREYGTGRVVVRAPSLPSGAARMILQRRTSAQVDANFSVVTDADTGQVADTLGSNAVTAVEGLNFSTRYVFRYVGVTSVGVQTPGQMADVMIPEPATVAKPGLPIFSDLTTTGVTVTAPALPDGALSLTLQVRPQNQTSYSVVATGLEANSIANVTYPTAQRNHYFRFVAVGTQGDILGDPLPPTSLPEAPVLVANSVSAQSVSFNLPVGTGTTWSELEERLCVLQRKKNGEPDSAYRDWSSGNLSDTSPVVASQLAPGTAYTFRWSIPGNRRYWYDSPKGGTAYGPATNVTTLNGTQPAEVGAPTFSNIGPVSVTVIAPATSLSALRANRLKLQRRNDDVWADVADNLAPGSQTVVTGLSSLTTYAFRYLAIANGTPELVTVGAEATVTTTSAAPEIPGVPTFVSATTTSITVTLPPITAPLRTASLTLQYKLASEPGDFVDWSPGHVPGDTSVTVTGLTAGRAYQMRAKAHAVVSEQSDTFGGILGTATTAPPPGVVGAPQFVNILDPYTVQIKAPATLPINADYLILQIMALDQGGATWVDITGDRDSPLSLLPDEVTEVSGLTPGSTYRFRYGAVGSGGVTYGPPSIDITMPSTSAAWASSAVNTRAQGIQCRGIRIPNPATGTVTVARGGSLKLSSYLATDWDQRTISAAGTPYTISYYLSDPCVYYWSARDAGGNSIGSFQDGASRAQNAVWIAPSTAGTYTITLNVSDQENANKAASDANSRDDNNRGPGDTPLNFQITVTVP